MNIRFLQQLDQAAEVFKDFCQRRRLLLLCVFSGVYLVETCMLALQKPMWNDELFTFHISSLPTVSNIWSALLTGGEQIPPFFHIITRFSLFLFGVNELAIRLPAVLGFWLMTLCLFRFVSKRTSPLYGFAAMLFPLVTQAYYYAYEARPYAIVLGCAGLSLVCWQSSTEGHARKLALVGLAASLGAAVSNHYYALLLFVPLFVGEAARSIVIRRIDRSIWLAFGFGISPLLVFLPLIERAKINSTTFWAQPYWRWLLDFKFYYSLLTPMLLPMVALLVVAAVYSTSHPAISSNRSQEPHLLPPFHEIAAALGFISIPIVGFFLAKFATGAITGRYVLPTVVGFSILFAFAAYRLLDGRATLGALLVVSLCGAFITSGIRNFQYIDELSASQAKRLKFLRSQDDRDLPIVASDLNMFTTLSYYAPKDINSRLIYLADPQGSLRYLGHNSVEQGILDLKPWFGLNVKEYALYIASQKRFLVYARVVPSEGIHVKWSWLLSELARDNRRIELKGRNGDDFLFLVSTQ